MAKIPAAKKSPKDSPQPPPSSAKTSAVVGFVDFNLHTLGWRAFQDLCATIMSAILGQEFQIFPPTKDEGIDGYFKGQWNQPNQKLSGSFTVQSKSTSKAQSRLSKSMLSDEFAKAAALALAGDADIYVLMTNHTLTRKSEKAIKKELKNQGIKHVLIYGHEWICKQITEVPLLRRMVPRIYGLGDLSQIIDHRAYAQAENLFHSRQDDLMKFVPTGAYRQCGKALEEHGIVLIIGEPGSGKTTIADILALSAADEWEMPTVVVTQPEDFGRHWNPEDPKQLFWIDDAFGSTQFESETIEKWNKVLPQVAAAIRRGARVIMTSRDYIYRSAEEGLKESITKGVLSSTVVIRIEEITAEEKKNIIYNHLKYGNQPQELKSRIKWFLDDIAECPSGKKLIPCLSG